MSALPVLLGMFLLTGCSACASAPIRQLETAGAWPGSDAALELEGADGSASGCPVGPDRIVTAAHVAQYAPLRWKARGREGDVEIVSVDKDHDLAYLKTSVQLPVWLVIENHPPNVGEQVATLGVLDDMRTIFIGRILGVHPTNGRLVMDGMSFPGTSGACIVSAQGKVYGIALGSVYWGPDRGIRSVAYGWPVWESRN